MFDSSSNSTSRNSLPGTNRTLTNKCTNVTSELALNSYIELLNIQLNERIVFEQTPVSQAPE